MKSGVGGLSNRGCFGDDFHIGMTWHSVQVCHYTVFLLENYATAFLLNAGVISQVFFRWPI